MPKNNRISVNKTLVGKKKNKKSNGKAKNTSLMNRNKPRPSPKPVPDGGYSARNVSQLIKNPSINSSLRMSECAAKYATAIANPWSPEATMACVPWGTSRMSQKVTGYMRFTATVGTNGVGFVLISPTVTNDLAYAWYSGAAFTGSTATIVATGPAATSIVGVTAAVMSNLPYTSVNLNPSSEPGINLLENKGRIVSVGVSASYTGTELNMGGLMYCFTDPQHGNQQGSSAVIIGNRGETDISNVSRDKCWLMCSATNSDELDFPSGRFSSAATIDAYYPFSMGSYLDPASQGGSFNNGAAPMLIMFTGTPGNTVYIEIVQHAEYIGPITEAKTSPSILDSVGTMTVLTAANAIPRMKQAHPNKKYGDLFFDALKYTGQQLLPVAVGALKTMLI